jgi:hypothetical protein
MKTKLLLPLFFSIFTLAGCNRPSGNNPVANTATPKPGPSAPAKDPVVAENPQTAPPVQMPTNPSAPTHENTGTAATSPTPQKPAPTKAPSHSGASFGTSKKFILTIGDRNLGERVLFKRSEKLTGALADGIFLPAEKVMAALSKNKTVCVFVSGESNLPNQGESLRSVRFVERLSMTRTNLPLRQLEGVFVIKDRFYSLHCEKKSTMKTFDVSQALGKAFELQVFKQ